jgi:hypothetical protein
VIHVHKYAPIINASASSKPITHSERNVNASNVIVLLLCIIAVSIIQIKNTTIYGNHIMIVISIICFISFTPDFISVREKNISHKLIMTINSDLYFLRNIIPNHPIAISGSVNWSISNPSHHDIHTYPIRPSKNVVPIFAPKMTPIACVNHNTPDPTSANVISAVIADPCNIAVTIEPVIIAHRLVVVNFLSKLLIAFDVFINQDSNTSKLNSKNPIPAKIVRRVVVIVYHYICKIL